MATPTSRSSSPSSTDACGPSSHGPATASTECRRMLLNPAAWAARDGHPRASYLVLDTEPGPRRGSVAYDFEAVGNAMRASASRTARDRLRTAPDRPMIGAAALQSEDGRSTRPPGTAARAYFRLHRRARMTAKEAASAPTTTGKTMARFRAALRRRWRARGARRAPQQDQGPGDLQLRDDQLVAYAQRDPAVLILGGAVAMAYGVEISIASRCSHRGRISYRQSASPTRRRGSYAVSAGTSQDVSLVAHRPCSSIM